MSQVKMSEVIVSEAKMSEVARGAQGSLLMAPRLWMGDIPPKKNFFRWRDGLYYQSPLPDIWRLNVISYRQNVWSTNQNNERNSRFWMQKCRKCEKKTLPRSLCSLAYLDYLDVGVLPAVKVVKHLKYHVISISRETAHNIHTLCNKVTTNMQTNW